MEKNSVFTTDTLRQDRVLRLDGAMGTQILGFNLQEEDFRKQFIGKKIPVSLEEIDAIAGATITTTAVVTAINEIAENLNSEDAAAPAAEPSADTTEEAPAETAEDSQIETAAAEVKEEVPAVKVSSLGNGR